MRPFHHLIVEDKFRKVQLKTQREIVDHEVISKVHSYIILKMFFIRRIQTILRPSMITSTK
jgi:mannitol-1-phosphate/altronate dehydrogenase